MLKKSLILLVLISLFSGGYIFAQEDSFPRHSISIDAMSTAISLFYSGFLTGMYEEDDLLLFTALQYEFQIFNRLSIAARVDYKLYRDINTDYSSISGEGHIKVYPRSGYFFLGGMFGYSAFFRPDRPVSNYINFGGRVGWRIDFSSPGGYFIEPSIGYYIPFGIPDNNYRSGSYLTEVMIRTFYVGGPKVSFGMGYRF